MQDAERKAASARQRLAFATLQERARCQAQRLDELSESSSAINVLSSHSARTCTTSEMTFKIEELKLALEVQAKLGLDRVVALEDGFRKTLAAVNTELAARDAVLAARDAENITALAAKDAEKDAALEKIAQLVEQLETMGGRVG